MVLIRINEDVANDRGSQQQKELELIGYSWRSIGDGGVLVQKYVTKVTPDTGCNRCGVSAHEKIREVRDIREKRGKITGGCRQVGTV